MAASDQIRNIIQTHTERTVIKQAPDLIVYLDGLPYLTNYWTPAGATVVNFNDFVVASSGAADVNTFIPSASVNLSIPNHQRHLFLAPGGNTAFYTMAEIKIFSKGYYLTADGQSVYERVFWGVIDNITQVESTTSLEVTLSCKGILHLLDLMQINLNPSAMTASITGSEITGMTTIWPTLNPILTIRKMFLTALGTDAGNVNTQDPFFVQDGEMPTMPTSIRQLYVTKWMAHLKNLTKGVRLFGLRQDISDYKMEPIPVNKAGSAIMDEKQDSGLLRESQTETQAASDPAGYNQDLVQAFLPSFGMGNIPLMESNITSRLAQVQDMVDIIGWEGYQDLDGSIIIKPPLYNLSPLNSQAPEDRNPFILHLDERIGSDSLVEDASQVRLTRAVVKGTLTASNDPQLGGADGLVPVGVFYDPVLIRQFGLRTEGAKEIRYLGNHSSLLYAYAVSELTKTIKSWKSYTVTIPMRPELKLGFPIHVPWRDLMAYLENISWTYTRGSSAQMTLSCSMVRVRELIGTQRADGQFVYGPLQNGILRWCTPTPPNAAERGALGSYMTLPLPVAAQLTTLQRSFTDRTVLIANATGDPAYVPGNSWVVQNDVGVDGTTNVSDSFFQRSGTQVTAASFNAHFQDEFFISAKPVDAFYCLAVQTYAMPYTDKDGYVLARPFPWGRYTTLEAALDAFTRPIAAPTGAVLPFESTASFSGQAFNQASSFLGSATDAFLLTGLGTPSSTTPAAQSAGQLDPSSPLLQQLTDLAAAMSDTTTCFTVTYPSTQDPSSSGLQPNPFNATATETAAATPGLAASNSMTATQAYAYAASMATGSPAPLTSAGTPYVSPVTLGQLG